MERKNSRKKYVNLSGIHTLQFLEEGPCGVIWEPLNYMDYCHTVNTKLTVTVHACHVYLFMLYLMMLSIAHTI